MTKTNVKRKLIRLHWLNFKIYEYKTRALCCVKGRIAA